MSDATSRSGLDRQPLQQRSHDPQHRIAIDAAARHRSPVPRELFENSFVATRGVAEAPK